MTEIDFGTYDLKSPRGRRTVLSAIAPDRVTARKVHRELLGIFKLEMEFRRDDSTPPDTEFDYGDSIYWCALLLYFVGDLGDVALMWEAKNINFDLRCAFDGQFLVGAGVDETITYLGDHGPAEAAEYIKRLKSCRDLDNLSRWEKFRIDYFYPNLAFGEK